MTGLSRVWPGWRSGYELVLLMRLTNMSAVYPGLMEPSGTVRLMLDSGRTIRPPWLVTEDHLVNRVSVRWGCGVED